MTTQEDTYKRLYKKYRKYSDNKLIKEYDRIRKTPGWVSTKAVYLAVIGQIIDDRKRGE